MTSANATKIIVGARNSITYPLRKNSSPKNIGANTSPILAIPNAIAAASSETN